MTPYNVSKEKEEMCPPVRKEHETGTRSDSVSLLRCACVTLCLVFNNSGEYLSGGFVSV